MRWINFMLLQWPIRFLWTSLEWEGFGKEIKGHGGLSPSHPPTPTHSSLAPWCLGGAPSQCDSLGNGHWSPNWPFDLELKTQELVLLQQHHHRTNAHLQRKIRTHTHKCPISRNSGLITIFTSCNRNMRNQFLERLYWHTIHLPY